MRKVRPSSESCFVGGESTGRLEIRNKELKRGFIIRRDF